MYQDFLIVVPAYNEEKNIGKLLSKLVPKFKNILVVDNNSQDKTVEEVKKFPVFCAKHKYNLGKSLSMKTGMNFAIIQKKKYIAYLDADGQHKVQDLEKIWKSAMDPLVELTQIEDNGMSSIDGVVQADSYLAKKILDIGYKHKLF